MNTPIKKTTAIISITITLIVTIVIIFFSVYPSWKRSECGGIGYTDSDGVCVLPHKIHIKFTKKLTPKEVEEIISTFEGVTIDGEFYGRYIPENSSGYFLAIPALTKNEQTVYIDKLLNLDQRIMEVTPASQAVYQPLPSFSEI